MSADNWDAYWVNAQSSAAHKDGGPQDEALEHFWTQVFNEVLPITAIKPALLDIACGNGAVARYALNSSRNMVEHNSLYICGVDESTAALSEMCRRQASLAGVAASALQLPFEDASFSLVTSQFGMEYAGINVFTEAIRVLDKGGLIAAVMHMKGGGIYKECEVNLEAINGFQESMILNNFEALFRGLLNQEKNNTKEHIQNLDRNLSESVKTVEAVLRRWGKGVASETLLRIYSDIGHMYGRLNNYEPDELFNWLEVMRQELESYAGRMSSMLNAALDKSEFDNALINMDSMGLEIRIQDTLKFGRNALPSAWVFIAEKGQA